MDIKRYMRRNSFIDYRDILTAHFAPQYFYHLRQRIQWVVDDWKRTIIA